MKSHEQTVPEELEELKGLFLEAMELYVEYYKALPLNEMPDPSSRASLKALVDGHLEHLSHLEKEARDLLAKHVN